MFESAGTFFDCLQSVCHRRKKSRSPVLFSPFSRNIFQRFFVFSWNYCNLRFVLNEITSVYCHFSFPLIKCKLQITIYLCGEWTKIALCAENQCTPLLLSFCSLHEILFFNVKLEWIGRVHEKILFIRWIKMYYHLINYVNLLEDQSTWICDRLLSENQRLLYIFHPIFKSKCSNGY